MRADPLDQLFSEGGVCPAAVPLRGAADAYAGCVCGVMLNDSRRADSILEGLISDAAGTGGVYIGAWFDPSTLVSFCFGGGLPKLYPDQGPPFDNYTTCPIWAAERDLRQVMDRVGGLFESDLDERTFDLIKAAETGHIGPREVAEEMDLPGELDLGELKITDQEVEALVGPAEEAVR